MTGGNAVDADAKPLGGNTDAGSPEGREVFDAVADDLIDAIERARGPEPGRGEYKRSILPFDRLPGFGDPLDDCGEFRPEARHFCADCYKVKRFKRVCYRHDCPQHAAHAARRRAAGSKDAAGVCPQLDALRRYLNAYRDANQYFHHLTIEPPAPTSDRPFWWDSDNVRERAREVVREIMDALGIQGLVAYHPFKGDHEDEDRDDMGEWRDRLYSGLDWNDVLEELKSKGHFHVVGVAPHVDVSVTEAVEEATGWVIHRIQDDETGISIADDEQMASAVTYTLSHSGVYETESGQRRLAAWVKGPDVHRITPTERNAYRMRAIVRDAAERTLGVDAPSFECDEVLTDAGRSLADDARDDVDDDRGYEHVVDPSGPPTPLSPTNTGLLPRASNSSAVGGMASGSHSLDSAPARGGSSSSTASTSSGVAQRAAARNRDGAGADQGGDQDDDDAEACGGHIKHISLAGEFLLDGERREVAPYADELEESYREYVDVMINKGLAPSEGRREIAEFRTDGGDEDDGPPPG